MGIVKRQSLWNAFGGYVGVVVGAVNALVVLPWAFAHDPEGFGFIRWVLSASLLVGAWAHLGYPHALVTFAPRIPEGRRADLFGWGLLSGAAVVVLLGIAGAIWGSELLADAVHSDRFDWGWKPLWLLIGSYVLYELVASQAQSAYRVVAPQWIKDVGRKTVLTAAAGAFALGWLDFNEFVWSVAWGHAVLTVLLLVATRSLLAWGWRADDLPWKSFLAYAGFMVLTAGAQMVVGQLDVLLIGQRLDLESVAQYSIAFQLGVVVAIPAKSVGYSLRPMIAEAWARTDLPRLLELVRRGGAHQWYGTVFLVFGLMALLPVVESLLPEAYRGVSELTVWIAAAQAIHAFTGVSGLVLLSSKRYRWDFWANAGLVVFIAAAGWWALPRYGTIAMGWILVGSALAYNGFKGLLVRNLLGAWPSGVRALPGGGYVLFAVLLHAACTGLDAVFGVIFGACVEAIAQGVLFFILIHGTQEVPDFRDLIHGLFQRFKCWVGIH